MCKMDSRMGFELMASLLVEGGGHSVTIVISNPSSSLIDWSICTFCCDVDVPRSKLFRLCVDSKPLLPIYSDLFQSLSVVDVDGAA